MAETNYSQFEVQNDGVRRPSLSANSQSPCETVEDLHQRVLAALATARVKRCPNCAAIIPIQMDTHYRCEQCKEKFCGMCNTLEKNLKDGFSHNEWDVENPGKCPRYLHQLYAGFPKDQVLDRYKFDQEKAAVENVKSQAQNENLWNQMVNEKFNGQPIVKDPNESFQPSTASTGAEETTPVLNSSPPAAQNPNDYGLDPAYLEREKQKQRKMCYLGCFGAIYAFFYMILYILLIYGGTEGMKLPVSDFPLQFELTLRDQSVQKNLCRRFVSFKVVWVWFSLSHPVATSASQITTMETGVNFVPC
jgi:hypothetical protein